MDVKLFLQREHPERTTGRHGSKTFVAGEERIHATDAARDGDVLHAVLLPRYRLPFDSGSGLELPELLADLRVERLELSGQPSGKHHSAGGREHAREARNVARHFPLRLAGHRIDRFQVSALPGTPFP